MTLDTTRADHTSIYNYSQNTTPFVKSLSKDGVVFENCYSSVPLTLPAHISLFSGSSPFDHKIFLNGQFYKPKKNYLPFLFKEKNYTNWAFVSSSILDRAFGMSEGFDFYEDKINTERNCKETLNVFKEKFKDLKEPFFLWIHFFDPHSPYIPPDDYRKKFESSYDAEIAYMDSCIEELFKIIPEDTISLIIGDHGELLGEHGELEHGVLLYEGAIKVPCLLINPEVKNLSFPKKISFEDIYKIIYDYFFKDKNLKEILDGIMEKPIISSSIYGREVFGFEPSLSLINGDFKLIYYSDKNFKLFNLKEDPNEKKDISKENRKKTKELLAILKEKKFPQEISGFQSESEKILKSLGYLMPSKREGLKDPEKGVLFESKVKEAQEKMQYRDWKNAEEILKGVLKEFPEHGEALSALGKLYLSNGENKKALDVFKKLVLLRKNDVVTNLRYAQALVANDLIDDAEKVLKNCIEAHPRLKEGYGELTKIYSKKNKKEEILNLQKKAEENEIEDFYLLFEVGKIKEEENKFDESFLFYHKSYKLNPLSLEVLFSLGRVSIKRGQGKLASNYYRQILRIYPTNFRANYYLGILVYIYENKKEEALNYLSKALNYCDNFEFLNLIKESMDKIEKNEKIYLEEVL